MRVLSDWRLQALLGFGVVAAGLGWMVHEPPAGLSLAQWASRALPSALLPDSKPADKAALLATYAQTPLHFEPNVGQAHPDVKFLARGAGYSLLLLPGEAVFHLSRPRPGSAAPDLLPRMDHAVLRAQLVDANPAPRIAAQDKQASYSNYFLGNDPKHWHSGVANYGRVQFGQIWPGIDLVYYGNQNRLEYDFIVQAGVSPERIRLRYSGANKLRVDRDGSLIADTAVGPVRQLPPVSYQDIDGMRHAVASHYVLAGNEVGFALGDYDPSRPLVIDPVLVYSSHLGGGNNFAISDLAVTPTGSAYVTGHTDSNAYPGVSPYQAARQASYNTVVSRFANNGRSLLWSTYLGGTSAGSRGAAIAVDSDDNAWVVGSTQAVSDFPQQNAWQTTGNSQGAGFVSKLAADGQSLLYSSYLSGSSGAAGDAVTSIALATDGSAWLAGTAGSSNFPLTANALQASNASSTSTGFISQLREDSPGSQRYAPAYSSYLGGSGTDSPSRLVLAAGDIFVAGRTTSSDFPLTPANTFNGNGSGSASDAFLARLSGDGQTLRYARYLGGSGHEAAFGLAVDSSGKAFVAGSTQSTDFPTLLPLAGEDSKSSSADTAFLTAYDNTGNPVFSTFLGSSGHASSVALTRSGKPVVAGHMASSFTQVNAIANVSPTDAGNGFIRQLSADGQTLEFSAALGGTGSDEAVSALALDDADAIYVAGTTQSSDFPLKNPAYSHNTAFARSGFVSKIASGPALSVTLYPFTTGINTEVPLLWTTTGAERCRWDGDSADLPANEIVGGNRLVKESAVGVYEYTLRCSNAAGETTAETASLRVVPAPTISLVLSPSSTIAVGQEVTLSWTSTHADTCGLIVTDQDNVSAPLVEESGEAVKGSLSFPPSETGSLTFRLSCKGPGSTGYTQQSKTMTVIAQPVITLTGTPSRQPALFVGDSVTYAWSSTNASSCEAVASASTSDNDLLSGSQPLSGSTTLSMPAAGIQSVSLKCTGPSGATASKTLSYTVYDAASPANLSITAADSSIKLYKSTTLSWTASNAQSCQASGAWSGNRDLSGSNVRVQPTSPLGLKAYTLTCRRPNPDGSSSSFSATANVMVTSPDAPTLSFLANPTTIPLGEVLRLNWSSQNTDSCTASGTSDWAGAKATSGSAEISPAAIGPLTLSLSCLGGGGASVSKNIPITVIAAPVNSSTGGSSESGGGPVDLILLTGLGLLGLARRQGRP